MLNNRIEEDIDATGSTPASLVTKYLYDPNQNLIQITKPEGNIVEYDYDERNLRIAKRVGRDESKSETGSVTIIAYDGNGNALETIGPAHRGGTEDTVMIDDAFRSGSTLTHTGDRVMLCAIDGFDRVVSVTDAVGNATNHVHDPGGRIVAETFAGLTSGTGSNETLISRKNYFDEAGRIYEAQHDIFMAVGTTVPSGRVITHTGGGLAHNSTSNGHTATTTISTSPGLANASYVLARMVYDRVNRRAAEIEDLQPSNSSTAQTSYAYDGANRCLSETDALNNVTQYQYDPAGNVILTSRTELSTIIAPTTVAETFVSAKCYDCLNRLVLMAEQGPDGDLTTDFPVCGLASESSALITLFGFDSRGAPYAHSRP